MFVHKIKNNRGKQYELFSFQTDSKGKYIRMIGIDGAGKLIELEKPDEWKVFTVKTEEKV